MILCSDTAPARERQTDRQTDGHEATAYVVLA